MCFDDFCRLTFEEFAEVCRNWREREERIEQAGWERVRMLSFHTLQPYLKKHCSPSELIPLPWDGDRRQTTGNAQEDVSRDDALRRFQRRIRE